MLKRLYALVLILIATTVVNPCWAYAPALISRPDYDDGITSYIPADKNFYFVTLDGYPVIRTSDREWFYVINPDPHLALQPVVIPVQTDLLIPSHSYYSILK